MRRRGFLAHLAGLGASLAGLPLAACQTTGLPFVPGRPALALKDATASIPIVATNIQDFVALGLASSNSHPGGNVTGVSASPGPDALHAKHLDLLKSVVPSLMRVAVLFNPTSSGARDKELPVIQDVASASSIQIQHLEVSTVADFEPAFAQAQTEQAQGLILITDGGPISANHARIAALALQSRLPDVCNFKTPYADDGFLMTYGADDVVMLGQAAGYVDRVLRGANPADLPIEAPTTFQFAINVKTAQTLGVIIPRDVAAQVTDWVQ
jgi:putative ABC transport system substrate-binding protein